MSRNLVDSFANLGRSLRQKDAALSFEEENEDEGEGEGDRVEVFDRSTLNQLQSILEQQAGELDLIYNVSLDVETDTFYGRARQRFSTGRAQDYEFEIGERIRYKLTAPLPPPSDAEVEFQEILEYAAKTKKKLNCKPGNIQCGGKCQNGNKNCFANTPTNQKKTVKSAAQKAKSKKVDQVGDLSKADIEQALLKQFGVSDRKALLANGSFRLATSGLKINGNTIRQTTTLADLYRKTVGVIPGDPANAPGVRGVVNGVNVFQYSRPWDVFGINPRDSKYNNNNSQLDTDVRLAYRQLAKQYHPDNQATGDREVFERLDTFYRSLTVRF